MYGAGKMNSCSKLGGLLSLLDHICTPVALAVMHQSVDLMSSDYVSGYGPRI